MVCLKQRENCGDNCDRFCPCIAMYPSLCTAFLSIVSAAVVAGVFGAYVFVTVRMSIFRFDWSVPWFIVVNSSFFALVAVLLLLVLSLLLWCTCPGRRGGLCFKIFYSLMLFLTILVLAASMITAIIVIYGASKKDTIFTDELENVWLKEVRDTESTTACEVQSVLKCRGFEAGDCTQGFDNANFSRCATNCQEQHEDGRAVFDTVIYPGCRERISRFYTLWNALLLSGSSFACILTLVAFFVTCVSVSFEREAKD